MHTAPTTTTITVAITTIVIVVDTLHSFTVIRTITPTQHIPSLLPLITSLLLQLQQVLDIDELVLQFLLGYARG